MTLILLGLGPGNPAQRTREADEVLATATRIVLRTAIHPGLQDLVDDPRVSSCDDLYEAGKSFDEVYEAIADRVLALSKESETVFAVPGHPLIGELAAGSLLAKANETGIPTRVVAGISALDVVSSVTPLDLMADQVQIIDATELQRWTESEPFNGGLPDVSPLRPVLVTQIYSGAVASAAKLALSRVFPEHHPVEIVNAGEVEGRHRIETRPLYELDRCEVNHLTTAVIRPLPTLEATTWPATLLNITARLRAPDGCPWDREQTHTTLRDAGIEEAYEVAEAIDENDPDHLAEELGDLVLHVAMQAQIAEESGLFSIGDVYDHINRKLVRRHPHVFGDRVAETPDAVVLTWNEIKARERATEGMPAENVEIDPFDKLPKAMPVMRRIAAVSNPGSKEELASDNVRELADDLLRTMQLLASAGIDPEAELERAYRRSIKRNREESLIHHEDGSVS